MYIFLASSDNAKYGRTEHRKIGSPTTHNSRKKQSVELNKKRNIFYTMKNHLFGLCILYRYKIIKRRSVIWKVGIVSVGRGNFLLQTFIYNNYTHRVQQVSPRVPLSSTGHVFGFAIGLRPAIFDLVRVDKTMLSSCAHSQVYRCWPAASWWKLPVVTSV